MTDIPGSEAGSFLSSNEQALLADYPNYLQIRKIDVVCRWCSVNLAKHAFENTAVNLCPECYEIALRVSKTPKLCHECINIFSELTETAKLFTEYGKEHKVQEHLKHGAVDGCPLCRMFLILDPNPDPNKLLALPLYLKVDGLEEGDFEVENMDWTSKLNRLKSIGFSSEPDQFRLTLSIYAESDDHSARYITQRPPETQLSSAEISSTAKNWVTECLDCHVESRVQTLPPLPTRVLDVGLEGDLTVKLHESNGMKDRYVALSYCWGTKPFLRTFIFNYDNHLQSISLEELPSTLKDAIITTRKLGFKYIWVDALCIIQDSNDDIQQQLGQMGDIYSEATLTIVAASASSVYDGFLFNTPSRVAMKLPFRCPDGILGSVWISPIFDIDVKELAWFTRAWCMQEKFLSKRLLVFTDTDIFWQCDTAPLLRQKNTVIRYASSDPSWRRSPFSRLHSDLLTPKSTSSSDLEASVTRFDTWSSLVMDYTNRSLSYGDDKLPAISGIASIFRSKWNDKYYAGLWESQFVNLLQWRRPRSEDFKRYRHLPTYRAPSWSWASVDGAVEYPLFRDFEVGDLRGLRAQFIRCELDFEDSRNPLGKITGGRIVMRAAMIRAKDSPWKNYFKDGPETGLMTYDYHNPDVPLIEDFRDHSLVIREDIANSWLMFLGETKLGNGKSTRAKALILKKVDGCEDFYERLGFYSSTIKNVSKFWAGRGNWREITVQ